MSARTDDRPTASPSAAPPADSAADPLAGATIVVHDLSRPTAAAPRASGARGADPGAPPPAESPPVAPARDRWAPARYGLVAVSFTLFGVFGTLTWQGRPPRTSPSAR